MFANPTSLFLGQLLSLVPHFSGIEEIGGDLHVAGSHLVDALRDGDGGAATLAGAVRGVASSAARGQLRGHWRWHASCFTEHGGRRSKLKVKI